MPKIKKAKSNYDWSHLEEYSRQCSLGEIAEKIGCTQSAVRRRLRLKGLKAQPVKRQKKTNDTFL